MRKSWLLVGALVLLAGCSQAKGTKDAEGPNGTRSITLTAGRTVNVRGAALYFGGFPRGPMITLECPDGQHDISDLEEGQTTEELCGVKVTLVKYGQSEFNNDNATFEVSW